MPILTREVDGICFVLFCNKNGHMCNQCFKCLTHIAAMQPIPEVENFAYGEQIHIPSYLVISRECNLELSNKLT